MKNKSSKKVAIVMPLWSPMRHKVFESIAAQPGVHLKVFFEKESVPSSTTWSPVPNAAYEWAIVDSYHPEFLKRFRLIPYRLPFLLRRFKPNIVIVVCLTQALFAMISFLPNADKLIMWTGESDHILKRRFAPKIMKLIRKAMYPMIDGFGCYSKITMQFLNQTFDVPTSKLFQIPQSVDNHHLEIPGNYPRKDVALSSKGKYVFLSVGRLIQLKGYELLVNAWSKLPEKIAETCILRIAGKGPLRRNLEEQVRKAGLDSVEFVGFVEYNHLPMLYRNADVFILPSLEDSWGFVINEAMATGLPVLCSKYAHASEMVIAGYNGYLFDPLSIDDTILKIKTLYQRHSEWKEMGQWGREIVNNHYSVEIASEAMLKGIDKILKIDG